MLHTIADLARRVPRVLALQLLSTHPVERQRGLRQCEVLGYCTLERTMLCRPSERVAEAPGVAPCDESSRKQFPCLSEYLGQCTWEDGSVREVSTVLCVMEDGAWKACLIDKALDRTLWVSSPSLATLLPALEKRVASPGAEWRKRREYAPKGKR